jgi:hypothetical protein
MHEYTAKALLPACRLDEQLLRQLWNLFGQTEDFTWSAVIGTGGDRLGKDSERPTETVDDWQQLIALLRQLPYIDQLLITVEVPETGKIAIVFRNCPPAGGSYVVTGTQNDWVQGMGAAVQALFAARQDEQATRLYSRWIFGAIQTAIPLSVSFIIVMALAALLVPAALRRSDFIWWITAGTLMLTLRLAYSISDRLILHVVKKFPYVRWQ